MAILGRDGQLIANASQRTIVMDSIEEFEAFCDNLPEGVNIHEAFDIYIRESGEVYAAGVPFKLRETSDAPVEVHVSKTGTGTGESADDPLNASALATKLATLAAHYDFNNQPLTVYFAPGTYAPITLFMDFLNCINLTFCPEPGYQNLKVTSTGGGYNDGPSFDDTQCVVISTRANFAIYAGAAISSNINTPVSINNIGIVCGKEGILARKGPVSIMGCAFKLTGTDPFNPGYYGIVHAQGGDIMVLTTYGIINAQWLENNLDTRYLHDSMFFADYSGKITFSVRQDIFRTMLDGMTTHFDGYHGIFMASDLGTIKFYGMPEQQQLTTAIDALAADRYAELTQSGWAVVKRNGILYLPDEDVFTVNSVANCDNTSTIVREGQE